MLKQEELRLAETLANGMELHESALRALHGGKVIDGETVFRLYDTFGFPVDLTADVARERGLSIDLPRFGSGHDRSSCQRPQDASKFGVDQRGGTTLDAHTVFQGYMRGLPGVRTGGCVTERGRAERRGAQ